MSLNNCATCDHKRHPDGGHCYMFRYEPQVICRQHTAHIRMDVMLGGREAISEVANNERKALTEWKPVPMEPTAPMLTALWNYLRDARSPADLSGAYREMLASAPQKGEALTDDDLVGMWRSQTNHIDKGDLLNRDALAFARSILALKPR